MKALIVDNGHTLGALAASRALADEGWTVGVGMPHRSGLAAASRSACLRHLIPRPEEGLEDFLDETRRVIEEVGYDVVFGGGDTQVLALSYGRDGLGAEVPYPQHELVLRAFDKLELTEAARRVGLGAPKTKIANENTLDIFDPPFVVKPRVHWAPGRDRAPSRFEAVIVPDRAQALDRISEIRSAGGEAIVQEFVKGRLMAYTVLVEPNGGLLAEVQQITEGPWPSPRGVSRRAKTVPPNRGLARGVSDLLEDLEWTGLAEIQFLVPSDGLPQVIDFNGRFYGSLSLAISSGLNLPAMWAAAATGSQTPRAVAATPNVRYQWLEGDLFSVLRRPQRSLLYDIGSCFAYARGAKHPIWERRDPWPIVFYLSNSLPYQALRHLGRAVKSLWQRIRAGTFGP